jgi:hypothetical protein
MQLGRRAGAIFLAVAAALPNAAFAQDLRWSRYANTDIDVSVDLPTDLFPADRGPTKNWKAKCSQRRMAVRM